MNKEMLVKIKPNDYRNEYIYSNLTGKAYEINPNRVFLDERSKKILRERNKKENTTFKEVPYIRTENLIIKRAVKGLVANE